MGTHHQDLAFFEVTREGVYDLVVSVREIGAQIDAIVLQKKKETPQIQGLRTTPALLELKIEKPKNRAFLNPRFLMVVVPAILVFLLVIFIFFQKWREPRKEPAERESAEKQVVANIRAFIGERFKDPIRLKDIAGSVNLSKGYVRAIFRRHENTTINRFLLQFRLSQAKKILEGPEKIPVSTVAFECGFENAAHFTTAFKNAFGILPSQIKPKKG